MSTFFLEAINDLIKYRLEAGENVNFHLTTNSMFPTLVPGDTLIVQHTSGNNIQPGAILLLRIGESWIVHRFLGWRATENGDYLITKGDNAVFPDPYQPITSHWGVVSGIVRGDKIIDLLSLRSRFLSYWISRLYLLQLLLHDIQSKPLQDMAFAFQRRILRLTLLLVYGT
jgi:hypothetical protein